MGAANLLSGEFGTPKSLRALFLHTLEGRVGDAADVSYKRRCHIELLISVKVFVTVNFPC
jgi:hypothetical protein